MALPVMAEEQVAQVAPSAAANKVTLQLQGVEVVEILKILAEQAGFNLVAGRNVSGRVTLFVKDVDPWEALEVILASNELAYEKRGDILNIMTQRDYELLYGQPYGDRRTLRSFMPQHVKVADLSRALTQVKSNIGRVIADEATNTLILMDTPALVDQMMQLAKEMDQPLQTQIFPINYGSIKLLAPVLQEAITKGMGKVLIDERTNQAAVTDYPVKLAEIARMIAAFDERASEVVIDAKIVQVTLSDRFQFGINWEVLARENVRVSSLTALNLTSGGAVRVAQAALNQEGDYSVLIEALRTYGDTKVISEPRITVLNNQEAKILVGSKEPYVTTQISQTGTGTAVTAETVNFIDIGVKLFVTPTISREGFVSMKIRPEVSSRTGTLTTAQRNEIPIVETAEAETVLMVQDGGVVILGGLIKDENTDDQLRTPILGDLPLIGKLFRSTRKLDRKSELVVFLSPKIITGARDELLPNAPLQDRMQDPAPVDYYDVIVERVKAAARAQAPLARAKGLAIVELTLEPDGRLRGTPKTVSAEDPELASPAETAVMAASPFPPFTPEMGKEPKTFEVPIVYE